MEHRILVLALRGRDGAVIANLLERRGHEYALCDSVETLAEELGEGAGAALVTEESLTGANLKPLESWLEQQEPWSDFPFVLLATKRSGVRPHAAMRTLDRLGNVIVLERPIHSETLESAVRSAMRVRRRQYEARGRLIELKAAETRLTTLNASLAALNASLENRIAERTTELSTANNKLMREVAERERAQAALVQSQKMEAVGQLTGGIAHDFNNLLTVVSGNLELIVRRGDDPRVARYAELARNATDRAAKLTHQLLAFSRTQQLALAPLDLNALVEGMNDLLDRTIGPQIQKVRQLDPGGPWVLADANQLELAVLNLAINARDAMPDGGRLTIATGLAPEAPEGLSDLARGGYGVIRVTDSGSGIPEKLLNKVFDPFFTTKPVGKGTGLGLSQVFGIARQSGGTAEIASREGEGTTVSIWLPLAERPGLVASRAAGREPERGVIQGHVLVVDDDDGVRGFIAESLEMMGYSVSAVASGAAAVEELERRRPDVMVVDFAMDGMNGAEVADRARALIPGLPIVLATGYAETEKFPVSAITLRKPFEIDGLSHAIRTSMLLNRNPAEVT